MKLHPKATLEEAFRAIGGECLARLERSRGAVEQRRAEGVHEMRVAIRRLRAGMSIFEALLRDAESDEVDAELEWLSGELADARDYDVFVSESRGLALQAQLHPGAMAELSALLDARRNAGFERAAHAVASPRYRKLVGTATHWIDAGSWVTSAEEALKTRRGRALRRVAREDLDERTRKAEKKLKRLTKLDDKERHELRIALKKLRYASEFLAGVFPKGEGARERFIDVLRELQDTLGELNDCAVHERIAKSLVEAKPGKGRALSRNLTFALGLVRGHEDASAAKLVADAEKAGKRLARAARFWR
jgi:triphosphatase